VRVSYTVEETGKKFTGKIHNSTHYSIAKPKAIMWESDNDNGKQYKYVCITTNQPDTKSNPNPTT